MANRCTFVKFRAPCRNFPITVIYHWGFRNTEVSVVLGWKKDRWQEPTQTWGKHTNSTQKGRGNLAVRPQRYPLDHRAALTAGNKQSKYSTQRTQDRIVTGWHTDVRLQHTKSSSWLWCLCLAQVCLTLILLNNYFCAYLPWMLEFPVGHFVYLSNKLAWGHCCSQTREKGQRVRLCL